VAIFRDKLKARGARGIMGIQRLFKIIDDDGSHTLSLPEFTKACKDFKIGIGEDYIPTLFNYFDSNRDGCLNIDEFLMAIRGELNEKRLGLIKQAFRKIDQDNSGTLEISDIKDFYRADKHPDVTSGKKTAE
jgi:calcyphosin